jgi:hypothetical protein
MYQLITFSWIWLEKRLFLIKDFEDKTIKSKNFNEKEEKQILPKL